MRGDTRDGIDAQVEGFSQEMPSPGRFLLERFAFLGNPADSRSS